MESAVLSIPIFSSKTLKYNPYSLHRNHFKPSPNQTLTKSSIRSIVSSNSHRSREFFSMSFAAILPENPSATARQLASASSFARASASGGSGESKPVSDSSVNEIILDVAGMMCDGCVKVLPEYWKVNLRYPLPESILQQKQQLYVPHLKPRLHRTGNNK